MNIKSLGGGRHMKTNKHLYTIIYPFMHQDLKLEGCIKEIFAVIFCFWISNKGEKSIKVSYSTIQSITGVSRPTVAHGIKQLLDKGLLTAQKRTGKSTSYNVSIPPAVLDQFRMTYGHSAVKWSNQQWLNKLTRASSIDYLQNKYKKKGDNINTDNLRTRKDHFYAEGMTEA